MKLNLGRATRLSPGLPDTGNPNAIPDCGHFVYELPLQVTQRPPAQQLRHYPGAYLPAFFLAFFSLLRCARRATPGLQLLSSNQPVASVVELHRALYQ